MREQWGGEEGERKNERERMEKERMIAGEKRRKERMRARKREDG